MSGINVVYDFAFSGTVNAQEFIVDLGKIENVSKIYHKYSITPANGVCPPYSYCLFPNSGVSVSADGITFGSADIIDGSPAEDMPGYTNVGSGSGLIRYIKFTEAYGSGGDWRNYFNFHGLDLKVFLHAQATHTTASTQIDGGANFWQWENFTDTKTVPANTSVIYRFRSSTNGSDWTGWVGSIGAVTSRTGDDSNNPTKYRYLQIEATLANTDGASTPTIDQYDIGYHTNQPPNKPTAMTAVVQ